LPGSQQPRPPLPKILRAEAAADWNARFEGKEGWIGGDGAASVVLGPQRILWLFGDTLVGKATDGKRTGAKMVNNSLGIQTGIGKDAAIRFHFGKTKDDSPAAMFVPADGKGWFWPLSGIRVGDKLFLSFMQIERTKDPGVFGFKSVASWLAVVENPDAQPEQWRVQQHKSPYGDFRAEHEQMWGSTLLHDDEHIYIYGYDHPRGKKGSTRRLVVARAPVKLLSDYQSWRFLTSKGWAEKSAELTPLADGLATEFSVSRLPDGKGYVTVYTEIGLSDRILGRFAAAPQGPWSEPLLLYRCPEMGKDKGVFSYAGKCHPWLANGNELLISYCVNTWDFGRLFREDAVYRPRFVRVSLGELK
jgi:hypothetical protein